MAARFPPSHDRAIVDVAGLPPFRRERAPMLGLDEPAVRRALRAGELVLVRRGVLIGRRRLQTDDGLAAQHALKAATALAGLAGGSPAAACLGTAALLRGIARLGRPPQWVRLYREQGGPWRDAEVAVLTCGLPANHVIEVMGIPTTTAARTAVDLGRWVTFRSAIVVMDFALHLGTDAQAITAVLDDCVGWPGVRNARRAYAFADAKAASPLEGISRVLFADHDLPAPELQVPRRSKTWDIALSDGDGTTSGADRSGSLVVYAVTCTCE